MMLGGAHDDPLIKVDDELIDLLKCADCGDDLCVRVVSGSLLIEPCHRCGQEQYYDGAMERSRP